MTCNSTAAGHRTAAEAAPVPARAARVRQDRRGERWEHFGYDGGGKVMCEVLLGAGFSVRGS